MMAERHTVREYQSLSAAGWRLDDFKSGAAQLATQLRPTINQFKTDGQNVTFGNVVGSFSLPSGDVVEVAPKVRVDDWTTAVIHLLTEDTRLAVTGSQRSSPSSRNDDLGVALALEYARRLERALRKDGPMQVYERRHEFSHRWRGQLDVSTWARTSPLDPTRFPMGRDELSVRNDFTRALSVVAGLLGKSAAGSETSSRLRRLQFSVIPGSPIPSTVHPSVARRTLPTQWAAYGPAWDIAAPLLRSKSVIGDAGRTIGLEVAVEPWRLLETLLERALAAVALDAPRIHVVPKQTYQLLEDPTDAVGATADGFPRSVEPDGLLQRDGHVLATFEAKYASIPKREHVFQGLATAAALSSPVVVLIYPWLQPAREFKVTGFHGHPRLLVTIGVDLFGYRRGEGERTLVATILNALRDFQ